MTRAVERRTERAGDAKQELRAAGGRARVAELGLFCSCLFNPSWKGQKELLEKRQDTDGRY